MTEARETGITALQQIELNQEFAPFSFPTEKHFDPTDIRYVSDAKKSTLILKSPDLPEIQFRIITYPIRANPEFDTGIVVSNDPYQDFPGREEVKKRRELGGRSKYYKFTDEMRTKLNNLRFALTNEKGETVETSPIVDKLDDGDIEFRFMASNNEITSNAKAKFSLTDE